MFVEGRACVETQMCTYFTNDLVRCLKKNFSVQKPHCFAKDPGRSVFIVLFVSGKVCHNQ